MLTFNTEPSNTVTEVLANTVEQKSSAGWKGRSKIAIMLRNYDRILKRNKSLKKLLSSTIPT